MDKAIGSAAAPLPVGHRPLHTEYFVLQSMEHDFLPLFDHFFGNVEYCTCDTCGSVMQPPE